VLYITTVPPSLCSCNHSGLHIPSTILDSSDSHCAFGTASLRTLHRTDAMLLRSRVAAGVARAPVATAPSRLLTRGYAQQGQTEEKQKNTGRTPPGPKDGAKPKILDGAPPPDPPEEVKQHNRDFEQRYDRAAGKISPDGKDDVGKGFWSGEFGPIGSLGNPEG
jgi:hypothetical protein